MQLLLGSGQPSAPAFPLAAFATEIPLVVLNGEIGLTEAGAATPAYGSPTGSAPPVHPPVVPPLKPPPQHVVGACDGPPEMPTLEPVPFGPPRLVSIKPEGMQSIAVGLVEFTCSARCGPPTIVKRPPPL